jgi:hypothetical protein
MVDSKLLKISCKTTYFEQVVVTILNPRFQLSASHLMDIFSAQKLMLFDPKVLQNVLRPLKIMKMKDLLRL